MDMKKMLQQVQELQAQMEKAQEELKSETVEASAGGGMVTVKATGDLQITEIKISPEAIDPDDPELLADMVLAAVNEALRSAQSLAQTKLGGMSGLGDLGGLGLPGLQQQVPPNRVSLSMRRCAPYTGFLLDPSSLWSDALESILPRIGIDVLGKATSPDEALT